MRARKWALLLVVVVLLSLAMVAEGAKKKKKKAKCPHGFDGEGKCLEPQGTKAAAADFTTTEQLKEKEKAEAASKKVEEEKTEAVAEEKKAAASEEAEKEEEPTVAGEEKKKKKKKKKTKKGSKKKSGGELPSGEAVVGGTTGGLQIVDDKDRALMEQDCIPGIGTKEVPGLSCKHIMENSCETAVNDFYYLKLHNKRVVKAKCDMEWESGGWTRILVCGPGEATPWNTWDEDNDYANARTEVIAMAKNASQVHIRAYNKPDVFLTSQPGWAPIQYLQQGYPLNNPWVAHNHHIEGAASNWYGSVMHMIMWKNSTLEPSLRDFRWPFTVFWTMNQLNGLHIINDRQYSTGNTIAAYQGDKLCQWSLREGFDITRPDQYNKGSVFSLKKDRTKPHMWEKGRDKYSIEVFMR